MGEKRIYFLVLQGVEIQTILFSTEVILSWDDKAFFNLSQIFNFVLINQKE